MPSNQLKSQLSKNIVAANFSFLSIPSSSSSCQYSSTWCDGRSLGLWLMIQHQSCWDWQLEKEDEKLRVRGQKKERRNHCKSWHGGVKLRKCAEEVMLETCSGQRLLRWARSEVNLGVKQVAGSANRANTSVHLKEDLECKKIWGLL